MTKEQQHATLGAVLAIGAIAFLIWHRNQGGAATSTTQAAGVPQTVDGTIPPVSATTGAAVPGTDINLGGSPAYLTYNFPEMLNGLSANPPWGVSPPTIDQGDQDGATPAGECCCGPGGDCGGSGQWTSGGIVFAYQPGAAAGAANLGAVGLASDGTAPTMFSTGTGA